MAKPEIVAGLDIGSAQAVAVIGRRNSSKGKVFVLGEGRAPCRGLKGGVVVNIPESRIAIARAVEEAEEKAKVNVQNLLVAVRGSHVETLNYRGAIAISRTDKEITAEDVDHVIVNAKAIQLSSDREILHAVPQDFCVDKQSGVEDPVGMEGSHLSVDVHIASASSSHLNNIVKSINLSGFTCEDLIYGPFACGDCVVSEEEKDLGVALIDLGGQTTHLSIYTDGSIRYIKELPIGGELISRDISYGLKTSFSVAEELKEKYGYALTSLIPTEETIEFVSVDGRTKREISNRTLAEIIQSRLEETFELIQQELQRSNYAEMIPGGIVLTGGVSKLPGIEKVAEEIFGLNVHLGTPIGVEGDQETVMDAALTTAIGLLKYRYVGEWSRRHGSTRRLSFFKRMRNWMDELY